MYSTHEDFNSIKVQLKHGKWVVDNISKSFQFHKGTIKTKLNFKKDENGKISIP